VTYASLVQTRRLAEAIDRLDEELEQEGLILARTMLEVWTNLRWIRLRDSHNRARRFLQYEPVEAHLTRERLPTEERSLSPVLERRAKRDLARVRHLFRRRGRWAHSWASSGTLRRRLADIEEADRRMPLADERTTLHFVYGVLCAPTHGSPRALGFGLRLSRLGLRPAYESQIPLLPLKHASAGLLSIAGYAATDLVPSSMRDVDRLVAENARLLEQWRAKKGRSK